MSDHANGAGPNHEAPWQAAAAEGPTSSRRAAEIEGVLVMSASNVEAIRSLTGGQGYERSRLNAVRHGILSRHLMLPWEDRSEYDDLLESLVAEHAPSGPTEHHLVEELAGIMWRKQRVTLAEAAACRAGLHQALKTNPWGGVPSSSGP
jgi:hypothetical protein